MTLSEIMTKVRAGDAAGLRAEANRMELDALALHQLADLVEKVKQEPAPQIPKPIKKRIAAAPASNGSAAPSGGHAAKRERIKETRDKVAADILKNGPMSSGEIKNKYGLNGYQFQQLLDGCEWFAKDPNEGNFGKYDLTPGGRAAAKVVAATPI